MRGPLTCSACLPARVIHAGVLLATALGVAATLLVPGLGKLAAAPVGTGARPEAVSTTTITPPPPTEVALATALVDALNQGDEDAVVGLFDPEATLRMDRYAWLHHDIRLWARAQIGASMTMEPEGPFQALANHALWTARVRRDDWRERGVESVRLASQILAEGDRILDFSADPLDGASVMPLGDLWRPGSPPDPVPRLPYRRELDHSGASEQVPAAQLALPVCICSLLVVGAARRLGSRATPETRPHLLVARLGDWQRRRREGS